MQQVRDAGGTSPLLAGWIAVAVVVVAGLAAIGYRLVTGLLPQDRVPVDVTVRLTPDAAGTRVDVVQRALAGGLPDTLDLRLARWDAGTVQSDGRQLPVTSLVYSGVRDGSGRTIGAEQVAAGRVFTVTTDGRELRLSFHVGLVGGRHVVYPEPYSDRLVSRTLHLPPGATCLTDAPGTDPGVVQLVPCQTSAAGDVDGLRVSTVRLELP